MTFDIQILYNICTMSKVKHPSQKFRFELPCARSVRILKEWLAAGMFSPGERLPAESVLAKRLRVSRGTLRAALKELEREGLLRTVWHKGRYVVGQERTSALWCALGLLSSGNAEVSQDVEPGFELAVEAGVAEAATAAALHILRIHTAAMTEVFLGELKRHPPLAYVVLNEPAESPQYASWIERLLEGNVPASVNSSAERWASFDRAYSDQEEGCYLLTKWLISRGCRRILRLWTPEHQTDWLAARDAGYAKALSEAGLKPLEAVRMKGVIPRAPEEPSNFERRVRQVAGYLVECMRGSERIDAILVTSDCDFFPTAAACRLFGREPGKDILIAGYDDYWAGCPERRFERSCPAATIHKFNRDVGRALAEMAIERARGLYTGQPRARPIRPRLVIPDAGAS